MGRTPGLGLHARRLSWRGLVIPVPFRFYLGAGFLVTVHFIPPPSRERLVSGSPLPRSHVRSDVPLASPRVRQPAIPSVSANNPPVELGG